MKEMLRQEDIPDFEYDELKLGGAASFWKRNVKSGITLCEKCNEKLKNKVNNLYYTIHTSPIKTCNEVSVYEEKIDTLLCDLEKIASENDEIKISLSPPYFKA